VLPCNLVYFMRSVRKLPDTTLRLTGLLYGRQGGRQGGSVQVRYRSPVRETSAAPCMTGRRPRIGRPMTGGRLRCECGACTRRWGGWVRPVLLERQKERKASPSTLRPPPIYLPRHIAVAFAFAASRARPCSASLQPCGTSPPQGLARGIDKGGGRKGARFVSDLPSHI
jgi:hypothetical protein